MTEQELTKKTIKELQAILTNHKIEYTTKMKKQDLIKLVLEHKKLQETVSIKKEQLENKNESSSTSSSSHTQSTKNEAPQFTEHPELPSHYGRDKIIFLVRDPYWGFVYWEVSNNMYSNHNLDSVDKYLRVYDISEVGSPEASQDYFDIRLTAEASSWYIKFPRSNRTFIIDYGYYKDGQFITIMRSNKAVTPRDDISDQVDIEWMTNDADFNKIMQASGGDKLFEKVGSQEMVKFIASNLNEENSISSGNVGLSFSKEDLALSSTASSSLSSKR